MRRIGQGVGMQPRRKATIFYGPSSWVWLDLDFCRLPANGASGWILALLAGSLAQGELTPGWRPGAHQQYPDAHNHARDSAAAAGRQVRGRQQPQSLNAPQTNGKINDAERPRKTSQREPFYKAEAASIVPFLWHNRTFLSLRIPSFSLLI